MHNTNPLELVARLKPFSGTPEEFEELKRLAAEDKHGVINPTDVVWKNGERVGFFSIGAVPMVWAWLSTKKVTPRDSINLIATLETIIQKTGSPGLYLPCSKQSPFYTELERFGYKKGENFDFFFKGFYV